jgi:hypothetical protein
MTVEDIYNRLMNGESDHDIAEELISMLNDAIELKQKSDAKEDQKRQDAEALANSLYTFFSTYYNYDAPISTDDILLLGDLLKNTKVEVVNEPHKKSVKVRTSTGKLDPDEIIGDFLDAFKLR